MGIFNEQTFDHPFSKGIQGAPGVGFSLTADGNYDMSKKKLTNVGAPSANTDAATKKYVDDNTSGTATTSRLTVDSNINMKDRYRITNLITPQDSKDPVTKYYVDNTFLDTDGSYPMKGNLKMGNNKIVGIATPTSNTDAATKKYVDDNSGVGNITKDIDLKYSYNIKKSKKRTFNQLKAATESLVSYEEVRENFIGINEADPMKTYLDMGKNLIYNVKTPTANDQAANKSYVDTKVSNTMNAAATKQELAGYLKKDGSDAMTGNLNMNNNRLYNLPTPSGPKQPTPLAFTDLKYLHVSGTNKMLNNLNMDNKGIINLKPPTSDTDAATKKYVDDNAGSPDLSDYLEKDGTVPMTGNLNMNNNVIVNLSDPTTDQQAANRGWVRKQIALFDHHSGDSSGSSVFDLSSLATPTTIYLQWLSRSYTFTTSSPGQPLVSWKPKSGTFINKIEFQFGSQTINVDYLSFTPRDSQHGDTQFWVSENRTGNWELKILRSWNYDMSGAKLQIHGNSNQSAITCRLFIGLPKATTKLLKEIDINTPAIVLSGVVKADINLGGNKIINLSNPVQNNDAANKDYIDKLVHSTAVQPSHYKDQFSYLMSSGDQWTDEIDGGDSYNITRIGDLAPSSGNFHDYNHKVLYTTIFKNSQGGYKYKMGINFYRLVANTDYTLCLELLNTDYQLWHKSQISVDKGSSTGLSIKNESVKKLTHSYSNSRGRQSMYYHRIIVSFKKLSSGNNKFFLHILVNIPQVGTDLLTYPRQFTGVYMIAYGIVGTFSNIDPDKVYDYHTAFDIHPTQVVYNVDINANNKKILNIALDKNNNNSAATVGMVKEIHPLTTNNIYRQYFERFYDFTNASKYKLIRRPGVFIYGLFPTEGSTSINNISFPLRSLGDIQKEGINVKDYVIKFNAPNHITEYTLCFVFYLWRNRIFTLNKKNTSNGSNLLKLKYDKTNNKLSLTSGSSTDNITIPSDSNGKRIVVWLAENFSSNVTKVKISSYRSAISIPAVQYSNAQNFRFTSEDRVLNKIMLSKNFYDIDSDQYHRVMIQEKLNGSYIR